MRKVFSVPRGRECTMIRRENRFLLEADLPGTGTAEVHVPDPGRLEELLFPGNTVLIIPASSPGRRTRWTLTGAASPMGWVLVNTSFHSAIAGNLITGGLLPFDETQTLETERVSPSGKSRFDILLGGDQWIEVKGCTLRKGDWAMFPDAPTTRGRRHVLELAEMSRSGIRTAVLFLVFTGKVKGLTANRATDPAFGEALDRALEAGTEVVCAGLSFDGESVFYQGQYPFIQNP